LLPRLTNSRRDSVARRVSWIDARAFAIWLSARERAAYRLPTEAEWERAARGVRGYLNPWGNQRGTPQVTGNWGRTALGDLRAPLPPLSPVGSFPTDRSAFGMLDMAGNVREWCLDEYDPTYYAWSPERAPYGPAGTTALKVLRGGAWNHPGSERFAVERMGAPQDLPYTGYGFRVVREIAAKGDYTYDVAGNALTGQQQTTITDAQPGVAARWRGRQEVEPDPFTARHVWLDVLPHLYCGSVASGQSKTQLR
jgi:formylglycine-generating enzyme required for sulfatase activity